MPLKYPKNISRKLKTYGTHCHYCDEELLKENFTVDHVVPIASGGTDTRDNKVPCCRRCNVKKGSLTLQEFRPVFFYMTGHRVFAFESDWGKHPAVRPSKRKVLFPKSSKEIKK